MEVEVEVDVVPFDGGADVDELTVRGRGEGDFLEGFELGHGPHHKLSGFGEVGEGEGRGAAEGFNENHGGAAAGLGDEAGATVVAGDEGGLGGGHGDVVVAFGEEAVDAEGTGDSEGDSEGSDEVLDIALIGGEVFWIEEGFLEGLVWEVLPSFRDAREGGFGGDGEFFGEAFVVGFYLGNKAFESATLEDVLDVLGGEGVFAGHGSLESECGKLD